MSVSFATEELFKFSDRRLQQSKEINSLLVLTGFSEDRVGNHLVYFNGMDWIDFLIVNTLHTTI